MPSVEVAITLFLAITLLAFIVSQKLRQPYTLVLVFIGILLAAFSISSVAGFNVIYDQLVAGGLFVGLVLPPLLFESMMDITSNEFRAVARAALSLATVGVVIATAVTGLVFWQLLRIPFYPSFLFASLISPTDTAVVLEVFRRVRVPRRLGATMETESAFNDATGITLFTFFLTSMESSRLSISHAATEFIWVFGGGLLIGLLVAVSAKFLLGLLKDPLAESVLTLAAVYGSFSLSEAIGVSGLVAVSITGITYGIVWATEETRRNKEMLRSFWRILAFLANSIAFLAIGLATDLALIISFILPIMVAFGIVLGARLVSVYSILGFMKIDGREIPNSWKMVATLGGIRGAVSIVLATSLPSTMENGGLIETVVLGVAFISIVLQGYLLTRYTKVKFEKAEPSMERL